VDAKVGAEKLEEKEVEDEEEEAEEENNCDKIQQPSPGRWGMILNAFAVVFLSK
jgi:hypothetical protein